MGPEAARAAAAAAQTKAQATRRAARRARAPEPASEWGALLRGVGAAGSHPSRARTLAGRRARRVSPDRRACAGVAGAPKFQGRGAGVPEVPDTEAGGASVSPEVAGLERGRGESFPNFRTLR